MGTAAGPLVQPDVIHALATADHRALAWHGCLVPSQPGLLSCGPPRHSRVCSSTMDTILIGRPSVVASNWKSTAHTHSAHPRSAGSVPWTRRDACADLVAHPQALVAPEPLDFLVVDLPALSAGIVVVRTEPAARMILAQSRSHARSPASGSAGVVAAGGRRWVVRFCPVTRQPNRSLTIRVLIRWCTAARRRSGLRSFPSRSP